MHVSFHLFYSFSFALALFSIAKCNWFNRFDCVCMIIAHEKWYDEIFFSSFESCYCIYVCSHMYFILSISFRNLTMHKYVYVWCIFNFTLVRSREGVKEEWKIALRRWKFEMLSPKCANHFDEVRKNYLMSKWKLVWILTLTTTWFAKVQSYQLHHIGFREVNIPTKKHTHKKNMSIFQVYRK